MDGVEVREAGGDAKLAALLRRAAEESGYAPDGCLLLGAYVDNARLEARLAERLSADGAQSVVAVLAVQRGAAAWTVEVYLPLARPRGCCPLALRRLLVERAAALAGDLPLREV